MARHDIAFTFERSGFPSITVRPAGCSVGELFDAFHEFTRVTHAGEYVLTQQHDGYRFVEEESYYADVSDAALEDAEFDYEGEFSEAFGVLEEAGLMKAAPEEPQVPRDPRTGLAIPAPGYPWTDTKGPVSLNEAARKEHSISAGDLVELTAEAGVYEKGDRFRVTRVDEDGDIRDPQDCYFYPHEVRKVLEEPTRDPTEFKQGDLVKVIRVTHEDDRAVLDQVGDVIGVDPTHTNGQTVHASFWDLDKGEDKLWWVHKDSLDLVYRPGSSS